jgi:putative endonuclease
VTVAKTTGQAAEEKACHYLLKQGLTLVARNYACKVGELDLIMRDGAALVFVEVRYRRYAYYGSGLESVTYTKQLKLINAAKHYLLYHKHLTLLNCRFDVVALTADVQDDSILWIRDAFQVE